MRRRLEDPFLAAGPLLVAMIAAVSVVAGVLALAALVAVAVCSAVPRRRRGRSAPPPVVLARLEPRRPRPRAQVSVAAVAGRGAGVRALRPGDLHGGRVRRATARRRGPADAGLRVACLHVATRANARLTDAA